MPLDHTKSTTELVAVDPNGITYIIQRRHRAIPNNDGAWANYYYCLRDGQPVTWLGDNNYRLPDGTAILAIECRLPDLASSD
ncbi:hypothetical protein ACMU6081_11615 [Achromobacter mucicolens]|uniref:Uncharacterized protein n=1 Tax=Achromobacter mucicolens TaxID=1389922 RepID=A0ABM8LKQ5_9BURK|nr:hypothetical protein LMG3415_05301 [Achromobacter mucicolens]